jgi:hypothetical protein
MVSDKKFPIVKRQCLKVAVLTAFAALPLLLGISGEGSAKRPSAPIPWTGPVPKAVCGPNDRVEGGLQGQTTMAERQSGLSELGFNCNLELVGQFQGEGSKGWMMAWFDDCAYYGTSNNPLQQHRGTVVVDASNPERPVASAYLDVPAMLDPHESLKVHQKRKLLAGVENTSFTAPRPPDMGFAVYDLSGDCRRPVLKADVEVPDSMGHAGDFTPDGLTYYVSHTLELGLTAIDVADPAQPTALGMTPHLVHDLSFSKDGTRAYLAQIGHFPAQFPALTGPNGLVILDVSDFQLRRPDPQASVISRLYWDDGGGAQQTMPVTYRGRPYLIFTDEGGSDGAGRPAACARGLPPHGFARIIDIGDERNPRTISKLMLEVSDPANCAVILSEPSAPGVGLNYSAHYCNVDRTANPTMMACSYREAGLRVFDVRDPFQPKEIAYYKPPARRTQFLPGSGLWAAGRDRTTDHTASHVRFRRHKGTLQIWFSSADNGFQIVRFTKSERELLGKGKDKDDDDDDDD